MDEPFQLLDHLGTGGFAHTYRARVLDPDLAEDFGRDEVALKIPLNRQKERILRRELVMNATLHMGLKGMLSAHLVQYLGFAVFRGQIVMAMEYVEQGSLRRRIGEVGRQEPLSWEAAVPIAVGALRGLSVIHQAQVVHRDVKPENILLHNGTPKIADLGIARLLDPGELAATRTGTVFYMSPETLTQRGASFTADIWSLGVTLYEMLCGRVPFGDAETPIGEMVDLIRRAKPASVREANPTVPPGLCDIVERALRKDPAGRFGSADEMAEALLDVARAAEDQVGRHLAALQARLADLPPAERERLLRDFAESHPADPRSHQALGEFYSRCQRYQEAVSAFLHGMETAGETALLHWCCALAYQGLNKRAEAARSLERAIELGLDASLERHAATLLRTLRARKG